VHKIPILDGALAMVSYSAANLIVSWIDHRSGDKADKFLILACLCYIKSSIIMKKNNFIGKYSVVISAVDINSSLV
jgi:hypothetical protein